MFFLKSRSWIFVFAVTICVGATGGVTLQAADNALQYPEDDPITFATAVSDTTENPRYPDTPTPDNIGKTTSRREPFENPRNVMRSSPESRRVEGRSSEKTKRIGYITPVTAEVPTEPAFIELAEDELTAARMAPRSPQQSPGPASELISEPVVDDLNGAGQTGMDPQHPPVRTAAFQGVIPGVTTADGLEKLWGKSLKTAMLDDQIVQLYSHGVLNHIEVTLKGGLVRSIVVQLDEPFPEEQVRDVLKAELLKAKPVLIPDENGAMIGEVFPEKGVVFLFATEAKDLLLVRQIGIEPVSAEPFVLRAEATLNSRPSESRRDLLDALRLSPDDAKIHGLLAQIDLLEGHVEAALLNCEKAIRSDRERPSYHLTYVQALINMNRIEEGKLYLEETLGICDRYPHEKAKALSMLGDLYRMSQEPNYEIAIECHSNAIRLAMTLIDHANHTIRMAARGVLLDAHLGAARDVAWGRWDNKEESIRKWIARAKEITRDPEFLETTRDSKDAPLKIAACALAAQVGIPDQTELEPYIQDVLDAGDALIEAARDPILIQKYQWETSLSLYDAVQIYQLRKQYSTALKYGELAADYMEAGIQNRKSDTDQYLLGRLYFRLGAIHAIGNRNHRAAIEWYDLAKPVFEALLPKINPEALGRLGETLVSMGVSYWMIQQREEAVRLTERGLKQIERGVRNKMIDASALAIPYSNLESMYRDMGQAEKANRYKKMASVLSQTVK